MVPRQSEYTSNQPQSLSCMLKKNGVAYNTKQITVIFNRGKLGFVIIYLSEIIYMFKYVCHESLQQLILRRDKFSCTCNMSLCLSFILSSGLLVSILL